MPSTNVTVRVIGGGAICGCCEGRASRRWSPPSGRRVTGGRIGGGVKRGAPGRCWPTPPDGRMPCGCCGRTGGVGSGRGPPGVIRPHRRIRRTRRRGTRRNAAGPSRPGAGSRLPAAAGAAGCFSISFGRRRGAAGLVGIAGTADVPGAVGSSILNLMLGGTIRPGVGARRAGRRRRRTGWAGGCSEPAGAGSSICLFRHSAAAFGRRPRRWELGASGSIVSNRRSAAAGGSSGARNRPCRLHQSRRRQRRRGRLGRLGLLGVGAGFLRPWPAGPRRTCRRPAA